MKKNIQNRPAIAGTISVKAAAAKIRMSINGVYLLIDQGRLRPVGTCPYKFRPSEILRFINENKAPGKRKDVLGKIDDLMLEVHEMKLVIDFSAYNLSADNIGKEPCPPDPEALWRQFVSLRSQKYPASSSLENFRTQCWRMGMREVRALDGISHTSQSWWTIHQYLISARDSIFTEHRYPTNPEAQAEARKLSATAARLRYLGIEYARQSSPKSLAGLQVAIDLENGREPHPEMYVGNFFDPFPAENLTEQHQNLRSLPLSKWRDEDTGRWSRIPFPKTYSARKPVPMPKFVRVPLEMYGAALEARQRATEDTLAGTGIRLRRPTLIQNKNKPQSSSTQQQGTQGTKSEQGLEKNNLKKTEFA